MDKVKSLEIRNKQMENELEEQDETIKILERKLVNHIIEIPLNNSLTKSHKVLGLKLAGQLWFVGGWIAYPNSHFTVMWLFGAIVWLYGDWVGRKLK